jgi:hypothetical protein
LLEVQGADAIAVTEELLTTISGITGTWETKAEASCKASNNFLEYVAQGWKAEILLLPID